MLAAPKNWALSSSSAPTDYVTGDAVIFDDSATGTTTVNVADANVQPALMSFNNSGQKLHRSRGIPLSAPVA